MAFQEKICYRDYFYLVVVILHLTAMLGVDFVPFYPSSLVQPTGSPLHVFILYREWYISTMSDPYYTMETPGHFFDFMVYIELLVQFPLALYFLWNLLTRKPEAQAGARELAAVVYGITTAICTAVVCHDMYHLGPEVIEPRAKSVLLYAAYMPYAVIPAIMSVDMALRLLERLDVAEKPKRQ